MAPVPVSPPLAGKGMAIDRHAHLAGVLENVSGGHHNRIANEKAGPLT